MMPASCYMLWGFECTSVGYTTATDSRIKTVSWHTGGQTSDLAMRSHDVVVTQRRPSVQRVADLLRHRPALIRGNASEIMAVAGSAGAGGRGTDSTVDVQAALKAGKQLARQQGCIVVISGATDLVRQDLECRDFRVKTQISRTGCAWLCDCLQPRRVMRRLAAYAGDRWSASRQGVHRAPWHAANHRHRVHGDSGDCSVPRSGPGRPTVGGGASPLHLWCARI